ncbi:hypothetical protein ACJJTC_004180 [Scirpophaga incertulas]
MASAINIEKLIADKKIELAEEKLVLGLSSPGNDCQVSNGDKEGINGCNSLEKQVSFASAVENGFKPEETKEEHFERPEDLDETIPADLERYIRRYLGLPVMLKAGEYSPNNPLIRSERNSGDVLLALGEYERRRNTLRRLRQQQYKEYLDQQAKKKQEAKEQADRERREREERDREREQRAREREDAEREQREKERRERERRLAEQNRRSPELRRASDSVGGYSNVTKVDSAVQVDSITSPLSVAVQTDDAEFFRLPSPKFQLTQAERELSPHTALDSQDRPKPANLTPWSTGSTWEIRPNAERRRSYGDYDERPITVRKSNRDKLTSDLRHSYMPSIFDADAIERRNLQAEKEAAARRQFYQQELKNQIMEQQRIKEERKTREKMLEQAEMRRLEEQLKMLRMAQEEEIGKQKKECLSMKQDAEEFNLKRTELQKEIDIRTKSTERTV